MNELVSNQLRELIAYLLTTEEEFTLIALNEHIDWEGGHPPDNVDKITLTLRGYALEASTINTDTLLLQTAFGDTPTTGSIPVRCVVGVSSANVMYSRYVIPEFDYMSTHHKSH